MSDLTKYELKALVNQFMSLPPIVKAACAAEHIMCDWDWDESDVCPGNWERVWKELDCATKNGMGVPKGARWT